MTQPAKVQEPSMEEILASIRRIIADDEAKPAAAEKAPASAPAPAPQKAEKPAAAARAPAAPEPVTPPPAPPKAAPPPPPPPKPATPAPAATNSQDDIDALLNGLDEVTTAEEIRQAPLSDDDVLELTDEMALPDPSPEVAFEKMEMPDDLEFAEVTAAKAPPRERAFEPPPPAEPASSMLSRSTASAVESAFNSLALTVLSNNARTLEDLVKEMLRPMLKSWLDDNLPGLVERIVKAEIERVSRGR
jgi:cell pole-organizing protein PopZ